jgi:hypothetical protein
MINNLMPKYKININTQKKGEIGIQYKCHWKLNVDQERDGEGVVYRLTFETAGSVLTRLKLHSYTSSVSKFLLNWEY